MTAVRVILALAIANLLVLLGDALYLVLGGLGTLAR
jgi:hypothetical protein